MPEPAHCARAGLSGFARRAIVLVVTAAGTAGCTPPPSDEALLRFFRVNRGFMEQAIALCKRHPALRSVEIDGDDIVVNKYMEPVELRAEELAWLRSVDPVARLDRVDCGRSAEGLFLGADFVFFARRLGMWGNFKALNYEAAEPSRMHPSHLVLMRKIAPHWYLQQETS